LAEKQIQTPENHPKVKKHLEHGESLKSRNTLTVDSAQQAHVM
jgi:hypothetical protein